MPSSRRPFFREKQGPRQPVYDPVKEDPPRIPSSLGRKIVDDIEALVEEHSDKSLKDDIGFLFEDTTSPIKHDLIVGAPHGDSESMADFIGLTPCVRRRSTLLDVPDGAAPKAQHNSAASEEAKPNAIDPRARAPEHNTYNLAERNVPPAGQGVPAQKEEDARSAFESIPRRITKEDPEERQKRSSERTTEGTALVLDDLDLDDGARPGGRQIIRRSTFGRPIRVIVQSQAQQHLDSSPSSQGTNHNGVTPTLTTTTTTPKRIPRLRHKRSRSSSRSGSHSRSQSRSASQSSLGQPSHSQSAQSQSHYWSLPHCESHFDLASGPERPRTSSGPSNSIYQPQTPGSVDSQSLHYHHSTPRSFVQAAKSRLFPSSFPSPDIFGMRRYSPSTSTPRGAGSAHARKTSVDSYFDFRDVPPPLPPLDHPAFREAKTGLGGASDSLRKSGAAGAGYDAIEGRRKHATHSLPSLKQTDSPSSRTSSQLQTRDRFFRQRSKSNAGQPEERDVADERPSFVFSIRERSHARNHSLGKSSIASSSRRSSAEYSAKQASSIGHEVNEGSSGCWEVDVTRAIISLSLEKAVQRTPAKKSKASRAKEELQVKGTAASEGSVACQSSGNTSAFGRARGDNVGALCPFALPPPHREPGGESWLGSPFLYQDPSSDSPRHRLRTDASAAPSYSYQITQAFLPGEAKQLRSDDMSDGARGAHQADSPTASGRRKQVSLGASSRRGAASSSPSGSRSRRGGPAISMPSLSEAAAPLPASQNLNTNQGLGSIQGSSTLRAPTLSVTEATPTTPSSIVAPSPVRRTHHKSTPTMPTRTSVLKMPSTPPVMEKSYSTGSAKRKAEEAGVGGDKTPPKESKEPRATFAPEPRTHRASATSGTSTHAPSSFNRSKRVRLSELADARGSQRSLSRAGTFPLTEDNSPNAKTTGSWSSRGSHRMSSTSHHHGPPPARSASHASHYSNAHQPQRSPSRRSLSQASIPISALISPHVASVGRVGTFHMRDPRKPSPVHSTPWSLSFPSQVDGEESRWAWRGWVERGGSPLHAWLFFIGFIIFPIWWLAALFIPVPRTRHLPADAEKGVILDDPQVEHDAKSWRTRCRVMAGVSLFTYVPFIVLVAIYA